MSPDMYESDAERRLKEALGPNGVTPLRIKRLAMSIAVLDMVSLSRLRVSKSAVGGQGNRYAYGEAKKRKGKCIYLGRARKGLEPERLIWADWS